MADFGPIVRETAKTTATAASGVDEELLAFLLADLKAHPESDERVYVAAMVCDSNSLAQNAADDYRTAGLAQLKAEGFEVPPSDKGKTRTLKGHRWADPESNPDGDPEKPYRWALRWGPAKVKAKGNGNGGTNGEDAPPSDPNPPE